MVSRFAVALDLLADGRRGDRDGNGKDDKQKHDPDEDVTLFGWPATDWGCALHIRCSGQNEVSGKVCVLLYDMSVTCTLSGLMAATL